MTEAPNTYTLAERPELTEASQLIFPEVWPAFVLEDPVAALHWERVLSEFADYQVVLVDQGGAVVGTGHCLPMSWDGTLEGLPEGWDAALERAMADRDRGRATTAAVGLSVTIAASHLGRRLSGRVVEAMRALLAARGHRSLVIPVRPNRKSAYPLTDMERYVRWTTPEGLPFDPWLRVHARLGGKPLAVCPRSMRIPGTVAQWEQWAGMAFPDSGSYVVPGALVPVEIDRERDSGLYVEPNMWVEHAIGG